MVPQFYRISFQEKELKTKQSNFLSHIICLKNYKIFTYFSNGFYQIWDIKNLEKELFNGQTYENVDKILPITEDLIILYDGKNQRLRALDLKIENIQQEIQSFAPIIPTFLVINGQQRSDQTQMIDIMNETNLISFEETQSILVHERKLSVPNIENYLTVFQPLIKSEHVSQVSISIEFKNSDVSVSQFDKVGQIILWVNRFDDQKLYFYIHNIWNKNQELLKKFEFSENIFATIVQVNRYSQSQVALWGNTSAQSKPQVFLMDINTLQENSYFLQNNVDEEYLLNDVYQIDPLKQRIIYEKTSDYQYLEVANIQNEGQDREKQIEITYSQVINMEYNDMSFSMDGNFFVQYCKEYTQDDDNDVIMEIDKINKISIYSVVGVRSSLMHLIEKKRISQKYGQHVSQQIIDMLSQGKSQNIQSFQNQSQFDVQLNEQMQIEIN